MDNNYYYSIAAVESCTPNDDIRCALSSWIFTIAQPAIVSIGTVGNILNIFVLSRQAFRSKPILILIPLAVFDLIFLWATTISVRRWNISQNNALVREQFSKTLEKISIFARGSSNLVIALFTVIRLVNVLFPIAAKVWLSIKRIFVVLFVLVIVCGIYTGFMIFGYQHFNPYQPQDLAENTTENITGCYSMSKDHGEYCSLIQLIYVAVFIFVPLGVACIGNIALIIKLKFFRQVSSTTPVQDSQTGILFAITGLLFTTSVIIGVVVIIRNTISEQTTGSVTLVGVIIYHVQLSNYALNFFLYLWRGTLFKEEFKKMYGEMIGFLREKFGKFIACKSSPGPEEYAMGNRDAE